VTKRTRMPSDPNQRGKSVVDIATGSQEAEEYVPKDPQAVETGRAGGQVGGKIRAARLSPERRSELARKAAQARWGQRVERES